LSEESSATTGAWITVMILMVVYAVNIADRYVLSTLLEPIKASFQLSDAAVGVLTGVALAIVYSVAGIPIAALADRSNRKRLLTVAVTVWSTATLFCGLSANFWQMLASRIGVGIGEAGASPTSHSLIADKFKPHARAFALSVMGLGASIGAWLGATGAGQLNDLYGWRNTLIIFGLAGLPVALLCWTIREPKRGQSDDHTALAGREGTLKETIRCIFENKALFHVMAGAGVISFWGWGIVWWAPAFLQRSFNLTTGAAGDILGPIYGLGGTALMIATALVMAWAKKKPMSWTPMFVALTTVMGTVPSIYLFVTHNLDVARLMLWLFIPVIYIFIGPTAAMIQNLLPSTMRAKGAAIYFFCSNMACLALAPLIMGFCSDLLQTRLANPQESLRWVLLAFAFTGFWAAYHYWAAGRMMKKQNN
jgi:MFS family permease